MSGPGAIVGGRKRPCPDLVNLIWAVGERGRAVSRACVRLQ